MKNLLIASIAFLFIACSKEDNVKNDFEYKEFIEKFAYLNKQMDSSSGLNKKSAIIKKSINNNTCPSRSTTKSEGVVTVVSDYSKCKNKSGKVIVKTKVTGDILSGSYTMEMEMIFEKFEEKDHGISSGKMKAIMKRVNNKLSSTISGGSNVKLYNIKHELLKNKTLVFTVKGEMKSTESGTKSKVYYNGKIGDLDFKIEPYNNEWNSFSKTRRKWTIGKEQYLVEETYVNDKFQTKITKL